MTRPVARLGDLTNRVRDALEVEVQTDPDGERARLLRDMLAYVGAPEHVSALPPGAAKQERLYRQINMFPGRTLKWHSMRMDLHPEEVRDLMYDLEAQGRIRRQSLTVLFCGPGRKQ